LPAKNAYGMAACQRHLWEGMRYRSTGNPDCSSRNVFATRLLIGPLDFPRLTDSIQYLTDLHDVLRTRLSDSGESPSLVVADNVQAPVSFVDISAGSSDDTRITHLARTIVSALTSQAFDLVASPPWCCTIIRLAVDKHIVCLCWNHLLVDNPSAQRLMSQLGTVYSGADIEPRPGSYARFASRTYPADAGQFWVAEIEAVGYRGAAVEAPVDSSGPQTVAWRSYPVKFGDDVPVLAASAMRRYRCTPYMMHAGAYCATLAEVFDRPSFIVGGSLYRGDLAPTPTSVGCYLDFAYFLYQDAPEASLDELVGGVRRAFLRGIENLSLKRSIIADIRFGGDVGKVPAGALFHDVWIRGAVGPDSGGAITRFKGLDVEVIRRPSDLSCRVLSTPYEVWLYSDKLMPALYLTAPDGRSAYIRANMSTYSPRIVERIYATYSNVLLAMDNPDTSVRDARHLLTGAMVRKVF
jgi:Condensation domain